MFCDTASLSRSCSPDCFRFWLADAGRQGTIPDAADFVPSPVCGTPPDPNPIGPIANGLTFTMRHEQPLVKTPLECEVTSNGEFALGHCKFRHGVVIKQSSKPS